MTLRETHPRPHSARASLLRATAASTLAAGLFIAPAIPASAAPATGQGKAWGQYLHAVSRAIPNRRHPNAVDSDAVWGPLQPNGAPATALATVQNSCAGCSGAATTLQVLTTAGDPPITAGNSATAYTTGNWASSSAVSVQVIATANARSINASNQAISVNVGCTGCSSSTVAIQFVLVGVPPRELSATGQYVVTQIEQALARDLTSSPAAPRADRSARAQAKAQDAAARASAVIAADTGAGVETRLAVDPGN